MQKLATATSSSQMVTAQDFWLIDTSYWDKLTPVLYIINALRFPVVCSWHWLHQSVHSLPDPSFSVCILCVYFFLYSIIVPE